MRITSRGEASKIYKVIMDTERYIEDSYIEGDHLLADLGCRKAVHG